MANSTNKILNAILIIVNPLIVNLLFVIFFILSGHSFIYFNPTISRPLLINFAVLTFIMPYMLFFLVKYFIIYFKHNTESNSYLFEILFSVINILLYGITSLFFYRLNPLIPFYIKFFPFSIMLVFVIYLILNKILKISLHISCLTVLLSYIFHLITNCDLEITNFLLITVILIGIIATILLFQNKYTLKQLVYSLANGILSSLIAFIFYYYV